MELRELRKQQQMQNNLLNERQGVISDGLLTLGGKRYKKRKSTRKTRNKYRKSRRR